MRSTRQLLVAVAASLLLFLAACGDDGSSDAGDTGASGEDGSPDAGDASSGGGETDGAGPSSGGGGTATFGGEEVTITRVRCFFEEQPRAGLGGVFTHTAQADGVDAAGVEVVIDMSRAIDEGGAVENDISFDIGDPFGDDFVGYGAGGADAVIEFGDDGVSGSDVALTNFDDFEAQPELLSFDLTCS